MYDCWSAMKSPQVITRYADVTMNRHWAEDLDRVMPFGRGARRAAQCSGSTAGVDVADRLSLLEDTEQLRDQARLDGLMYTATERFIDSLHGPSARPISIKDGHSPL